jgi:hypothetical protein
MWSFLPLLLVPFSGLAADTSASEAKWKFDVKETRSGVLALESIVVSPTLVIFFDRQSLIYYFRCNSSNC